MVNEFQVLSDKMDDMQKMFEQRFHALEAKIEEDRANIRELLELKIQRAEERAEMAHKRIDEQKLLIKAQDDEIKGLQRWRYIYTGAAVVAGFFGSYIAPKVLG